MPAGETTGDPTGPAAGRRRARGASAALALLLVSLLVPAVPAAAAVPDSFTITGSGYGHGVGMPQYGAYQMAREGASADRILRHYYAGTRTGSVRTPATIDVQVHGPDPYAYGGYGDERSATTIRVRDGWWRLLAGGKQIESGPPGALRVSVSKGSLVVKADGRTIRGRSLALEWSGTAYFKPSAGRATVTVGGAHGTYRHGRMMLSAISGVPNVVNRLRLNTEYLYGVAEVPSSWGRSGGAQALRAQAIVARSYAVLKARDVKPGCRCHLVDDVRDQQFTGWEKEAEPTWGVYWRDAVKDTRSSTRTARVLTYDGAAVEAHYFSSSGGRTARSQDVWSTALPYEQSEPDPYSAKAPGNRYASWTRVMTQERARDLFGLGNVRSIEVTRYWPSGQARTLTATSARGATSTVTGKADQIRSRVGAHTREGNLPASWISAVRAR